MARPAQHNTRGATWLFDQCGAGHCWHTDEIDSDELDASGQPAEQEACYRRCCRCGAMEYTMLHRAHAVWLDAQAAWRDAQERARVEARDAGAA